MEDPSEESGPRVRVALVGCTGLLGEIIAQAVSAAGDFAVVADVAAPGASDDPLTEIDADLLLWNNADERRLSQWLDRLSARCGPRVLATLGDGRDASLWELAPHRTELGALAPTTLVEAIRTTLRSSGGVR